MMRLKDKELKRKRLLKPKKKDNGVKKNIRTKNLRRFQVAGSGQFKFIKTFYLTQEVKKLFGRNIFKIIPPEMKQPGFVPILSVYLDKENKQMVLRAELVEHEDYIIEDENGEAKFVPDTEFKK